MTTLTFLVICQFQEVLSNLEISVIISGVVCALILCRDCAEIIDYRIEMRLYGKRQDEAGYWRLAEVPQYSTNSLDAY
jgi:hypothetical protein